MIKKKKIFTVTLALGLATVALASCGKKDTTKNDTNKDNTSDTDKDNPAVTYSVELDTNDSDATFAEGAVKNYTVTSATDLLAQIGTTAPTKTGYTFSGWYVDMDCSVALSNSTDISTLEKDPNGKIYIYAKYSINTFTVTFDLKGNADVAAESAIATTAEVEYNENVEVIPSTFTKYAKDSKGHELTFTGWYNDEACTEAVDPTTTTISADKTFYAGWTIVEIKTAEEFKAYVNQKSVKTNAYLSADLETVEIDRSKTTCDASELSNGTNLINEFEAKFYGDNHTITGLTITGTDLTNVALFGKFSGTMQDVTFKSSTLTSNKKTSGIIAGEITGDAVLSDITFDGVEATNTGGDGYGSIVVGQVKGTGITATFEGITVINAKLTTVKYSGGVISGINASSDVTLNFTDCLFDIDIKSTDTSNGSIGIVFGYQQADKSKNCKINFDGVIAKGTIDSVKNTGAFIGDLKNADATTYICTVSIKNSAVIGYKSLASGGASNTTNVFVGNKYLTTTTITDSYYQEYGTNILIKGDYAWDLEKQGDAASLETLATKTLSSNITLAYESGALTATLNGNSIKVKETQVVDLAGATCGVKTPATGEIITSVEGQTNTYRYTNYLNYYEKAVAGKAGYGIKVEFELPELANNKTLTILKGVSVKGLTSYSVNGSTGIVTGYIIFDNETIDSESGKTELETVLETETLVSKEIKIVWGNDDTILEDEESTETIYAFVKPVTYTVNFQNSATHSIILKGDETAHAAIALESAEGYSTGLTAEVDSADNTKLNITEGEIAYNATHKGNTVFVKFSVPSGITTTATSEQEFSNCTFVSGDKTQFILAVNVAKGNTKFSFTWDKAKYDMDEYTINVADAVTLVANSDASTSTTLTSTLYTLADLADTSLAAGASVTWGKDLTIVASSDQADKVFIENASANTETYTDLTGTQQTAAKRLKVSSAKANGVYVKIDLSAYTGSVDIKVSYCTGSNNSPRHLILWKEGNFDSPKSTADNSVCKTSTEDILTVDAGSIYYLGSAKDNMYIYAISLIAK